MTTIINNQARTPASEDTVSSSLVVGTIILVTIVIIYIVFSLPELQQIIFSQLVIETLQMGVPTAEAYELRLQ